MIRYLAGRRNFRLIAMEGASGPVDPGPIRSLPKDARPAVVRTLIHDGSLTGAEAAFAQDPGGELTLWGVEDPGLYEDHLQSHVRAQAAGRHAARRLRVLEAGLERTKREKLSPGLRRLDRLFRRYRDGKDVVHELVRSLKKHGSRAGLDLPKALEDYENLNRITASLDAGLLRVEASGLFRELLDQSSPGERRLLMKRILDYRLGNESEQTFYAMLLTRAEKKGKDPALYPQVQTYRRLLNLERTLSPESLDAAVRDLFGRIFSGAVPELYEEARQLELLRRLIRLELSGADWEELKRRFAGDDARSWLKEALGYYDLADRRSGLLVERALKKASDMRVSRIVMVCGGFHREGIVQVLKQRGISFRVVQPRSRDLDSPFYLERLRGRRVGIEHILPAGLLPAAAGVRAGVARALAPAVGTAVRPLVFPWMRTLLLEKAYLLSEIFSHWEHADVSPESIRRFREGFLEALSPGERLEAERFLETLTVSRVKEGAPGTNWLRIAIGEREWLLVIGQDGAQAAALNTLAESQGSFWMRGAVSYQVFDLALIEEHLARLRSAGPSGIISRLLTWFQVKFALLKDVLLKTVLWTRFAPLKNLSRRFYLSRPDGLDAGEAMKRFKPSQIAGMMDHTLLGPGIIPERIDRMVAEAAEHGFGLVMLMPLDVPAAIQSVRQRNAENVKIGAVVGFPMSGLTRTKVIETEFAVRNGASEIDMVIDHASLIRGRDSRVLEDIRSVVQTAKKLSQGRVLVKVIIETGILTPEEKIRSTRLVRESGADAVKTSTGFFGPATVEDVALMRLVSGPGFMVKASGGIRNLDDAVRMVEAGADRLGTSKSVNVALDLAKVTELILPVAGRRRLLARVEESLDTSGRSPGADGIRRGGGYEEPAGQPAQEPPGSETLQAVRTLERSATLKRINLVCLRPRLSTRDLEEAAEALRVYGFRSVILASHHVAEMSRILRVKGVERPVIAAVGYPFNTVTEAKQFEVEQALKDGAAGIKTVMDVAALRGGDPGRSLNDLRRVIERSRELSGGKARVDVILDAALLKEDLPPQDGDRLMEQAVQIILKAGADGISLNTGWKGRAEPEDIALVRRFTEGSIPVTASGGVTGAVKLTEMLQAGADAVSASDALKIVRELDFLQSLPQIKPGAVSSVFLVEQAA